MTWCATGPTPDVAPSALTADPSLVLIQARARALFYGAALVIRVAADGAAEIVAVVRPEMGPAAGTP